MMTSHSNAVVVDRLTRKFKDVTAVEAISFEVAHGELFSLVGPDGAGKTTTLRMLAGILRPTSGDATILGESVASDPERVKPHIAYMPQRFGLYSDLTVEENIHFYADLFDVPLEDRPRQLDKLYSFSRLGPFKTRLAGNLSGGMKQKLGICCAMVHQPDVMLLDEPTFGVDPISRRDLWLIVHQMVEEGTTVIASTAYLDEAERSDRVAMLNEGRVLTIDDPQVLQAQLKGYLYKIEPPDPRTLRDALQQQDFVKRATLFGTSIHVVVGSPERDRLLLAKALQEHGLPDEAITDAEPSLEDVFLNMIEAPESTT